jgi:hypothetical protein
VSANGICLVGAALHPYRISFFCPISFVLLAIEGATAHRAKVDNPSRVRAYLPDGT